MDKDSLFEAVKKKYKSKILFSNKKSHKFVFRRQEYSWELQRLLFQKDIASYSATGKVVRLT